MTPAAVIFELIGVLLHDVAGAEAVAADLDDKPNQSENAQAIRACAAVSRQLAAFLADLARDGLAQSPSPLKLDDCAGYLLSVPHLRALQALVNAPEVHQ